MHVSALRVALIAIVLLPHLPLRSESVSPAPPKGPEEPSVRPVAEGEREMGEVPVLLVTARGGRMRGRLTVGARDLDVPVLHGDVVQTVKVAVADIGSIEFLRWRGRELRKNEYSFRPVVIRIILRDGRQVETAGHVAALERFTFREDDAVRTVFSRFRDYRKGGRWVHSGATAMDHPDTHPHGDALVRIVFETPAASSPLEMLFRRK